VSEPPPPPVAVPDWQQWQVTATGPWPTPDAAEATINWRTEGVVFVLVTAYSVVLGGVVGLIWPRVAPHLHLLPAINGSEAATKALLGDDLWLGLLGIVAGVLCVAVLALVAKDAAGGPGALLGLAAGGVLGSLVAAHVGHLVEHPHVVSALRAAVPAITHREIVTILGYFDFRLRYKAVLVAWPVTAVAVQAGTTMVRSRRIAARGRDVAP
jgi:hypothetical protein